ncbi:MAG TPA: class I SAM-dependent methyltransferase [Anaerolineales bacterium]|nr:class I SAM-dependent methyltransferase [Anaerolineales bacterium]
MTEATIYIQRALEANPLREPTLRSVIQTLLLPAGSQGLDAGCGIGLQTLLLAEAVGPEGRITGLDILHELLAYGEDLVAKEGLSERVTFRAGDVSCLPFDHDSFDWVWSADCVGYPAADLAPLLKELVRVVKPGGSVILLGWSSQQLLPGYPLLEAQLNATCSGYIPFFKGKTPEQNFMRALTTFRQIGLEGVEARTFVGDVQAPLSSGERIALTSLFEMLWGEPQSEVSAEDWAAYKQLCIPESPDFILNLPDYYAFFTYSMFRGKVRKP